MKLREDPKALRPRLAAVPDASFDTLDDLAALGADPAIDEVVSDRDDSAVDVAADADAVVATDAA